MNLSPFFEKSLVRGRGEGVQSLNLGQMYKKPTFYLRIIKSYIQLCSTYRFWLIVKFPQHGSSFPQVGAWNLYNKAMKP